MLRSILVALDATPASSAAQRLAIDLAEAEALDAKPMGASGHRPSHDFLLGSTTQRLLDACPCPLFVRH